MLYSVLYFIDDANPVIEHANQIGRWHKSRPVILIEYQCLKQGF